MARIGKLSLLDRLLRSAGKWVLILLLVILLCFIGLIYIVFKLISYFSFLIVLALVIYAYKKRYLIKAWVTKIINTNK